MSIFNEVESSYYIKFFSLRDERDVNPFARDRTQDLLIARRPLPHYTTEAGVPTSPEKFPQAIEMPVRERFPTSWKIPVGNILHDVTR